LKPDIWKGNILLLTARQKFCIAYYRNIYINTRGGVYISHSRACVQYTDSLDRALLRTQKLLKQGYVEVIAAHTLRSLSRSGWLLRNIHSSNDNGCFTFYVDLFFNLLLPRLLTDSVVYSNVWVARRVSNKKQDLLTLREHMSSPRLFGEVCVADLFSVLYCPIVCLYVLNSVLWCPFAISA
jgi:hypothetical protein